MSYEYAPYVPIYTLPGQTLTGNSGPAQTINYSNGQITFTGNTVASGNIQLTGEGQTQTILTGANMPASFVSDKFIQANQPVSFNTTGSIVVTEKSIHERMTEAAKNGAELHPLLKKVIDEANALEKDKQSLSQKIDNLSSDLDIVNRMNDGKAQLLTTAQALIDELKKKTSNQDHNIKEMQRSYDELKEAHDALREVIRDYSEESVNEIVEDYKTQLSAYEEDIQYYERLIREHEKKGSESMTLVAGLPDNDKFTDKQTEEIVAAFRRDLAAIQDPAQRDEILKKMNGPVGGFSQEQVDKLVAEAKAEGKLELLAQQDAEVPHEDRLINIGPGAKVYQASTGRGPFWTQVLKTFRHKDKEKSTSPGWLVHNVKGKEEHYPVGDLTDKEPSRNKGPNRLKLALVGSVNAIGTQLIAYQAFGAKALIPMAIAQTIIAGITYWEFSKK